MEYKVAQKLFEIAQLTLPLKDKHKMIAWANLPDETKSIWFTRARDVIKLIESYCPFSPEYIIENRG